MFCPHITSIFLWMSVLAFCWQEGAQTFSIMAFCYDRKCIDWIHSAIVPFWIPIVQLCLFDVALSHLCALQFKVILHTVWWTLLRRFYTSFGWWKIRWHEVFLCITKTGWTRLLTQYLFASNSLLQNITNTVPAHPWPYAPARTSWWESQMYVSDIWCVLLEMCAKCIGCATRVSTLRYISLTPSL